MKKVILFITLSIALISAESGYCSRLQESWQDISSGIDEIDLKTVAVNLQNPDIIYAGSTKCIFKTSDGGKNWQKVYAIRGTSTLVNTISVDSKNTDTIYAGTQNGLYKSTDAGISWNRIFEGPSPQEKNIRHIAIDHFDANRLYIGSSSGIFITQDKGATWNKLNNKISNQAINFTIQDPINLDIIYVAADTGLYKSSSRGLSFEKKFIAAAQTEETETDEIYQDANTDEIISYSNKMPNCIAIDSRDNNKIYIGTNSGIFASADAGETWKKLTGSGLINNKVESLISTKNGWLYAATKNGIFKISSPYHKWEEVRNGLRSKEARHLAYNQINNSVLAATAKGIYQTYINSDDASPLPDEDTAKILAGFKSEPNIQQTQEIAIRYAEVHKEKIDEWRKNAKQKAVLPNLSVSTGRDLTDYYHWDSGTNPDTLQKGKDTVDWSVTLSWDLGELVWNDDQTSIDVRSRLMVQLRDDILNEVTQLYFERRRLQIELLTNPPKNMQHRLNKELRLQELTAGIDALTGGWFSKEVK